MRLQFIVPFCLLFIITSCDDKVYSDSTFFYNTQKTIINKECNPLSNNGRTWAYTINNDKFIYNCNIQNKKEESLFLIVNQSDSILKKVKYPIPNTLNWIITYNGNSLVSLPHSKSTSNASTLKKIDLTIDSVELEVEIPNGYFRTSEHPISENEIFVYSSNGKICVYDFTKKELNINIVETSVPPVISKDGVNILFIRDKKLLVYNRKDKTEKLIYNLDKIRNFNPFSVYFGNEKKYIVKGSYTKYLFFEDVKSIIIDNKGKRNRVNLDIYRGYRYY